MDADEWVMTFHDEDTFLAFGKVKNMLPVYRLCGNLEKISRLEPMMMNFPGCPRFNAKTPQTRVWTSSGGSESAVSQVGIAESMRAQRVI